MRTAPTRRGVLALIGALLRIPWEIVRERMLEGLHQRGFTDLIPADLTVLQYPGPDNLRRCAASTRSTSTLVTRPVVWATGEGPNCTSAAL